MEEQITFDTVHPEYGFNHKTDEEFVCGASMDLKTLHEELGRIPHPLGICNNPSIQQELWIAFSKHNKQNGERVPLRGHEFSIPGILNWVGTNIGFYDHDHEYANENGFVCTVEDDEVDIDKSRFFIFWGEEVD